MQKKDSNKIDQKLIDKIISVAYGDAGLFERFYVLWKASIDKEIKNLFDEFKLTVKTVRKLKKEEVSDPLIKLINNNTTGGVQSKSFISFISKFFYNILGNRAIPATALGLILVIAASFLIFKEPSQQRKYSKVEIELAEKQFRQTLTIVGKVFESAEKSFSLEILDKQVNKKLNKGYYLVNNILIGG